MTADSGYTLEEIINELLRRNGGCSDTSVPVMCDNCQEVAVALYQPMSNAYMKQLFAKYPCGNRAKGVKETVEGVEEFLAARKE